MNAYGPETQKAIEASRRASSDLLDAGAAIVAARDQLDDAVVELETRERNIVQATDKAISLVNTDLVDAQNSLVFNVVSIGAFGLLFSLDLAATRQGDQVERWH